MNRTSSINRRNFTNIRKKTNKKKIEEEMGNRITKALQEEKYENERQKETNNDYRIGEVVNIPPRLGYTKGEIAYIDIEKGKYAIRLKIGYGNYYAKSYSKEELDKYNPQKNQSQNSEPSNNKYEEEPDNLNKKEKIKNFEDSIIEGNDKQNKNLNIKKLTSDELRELENTPLTDKALLFIDEYLIPKNKIDLGNGTILYTTNTITSGSRPQIIGYIIEGGRLHVRLFYRSNSEGCRRACPGLREVGGYSKGEFIPDYSYETTTKVDPRISKLFDSLKEHNNQELSKCPDPIIDISKKCLKQNGYGYEILQNEVLKEVSINGRLFPDLPGSAVFTYQKRNAEEVINLYNKAIPKGLDYKNMKYSGKSYSYTHKYLGEVDVKIYTINRNSESLDFHFSRAKNSPDKVRIENVTYTGAQLNSFGVYDKQINAGPLVAKPIDYATQNDRQVPLNRKGDRYGSYMDIRDLYQGNPIIKHFKNISNNI